MDAAAAWIDRRDLLAAIGKLELERRAMRAWILQAGPMLSIASCIVIDDAVDRLDEIAGCRGLLEMCPVDFTNLEENV